MNCKCGVKLFDKDIVFRDESNGIMTIIKRCPKCFKTETEVYNYLIGGWTKTTTKEN